MSVPKASSESTVRALLNPLPSGVRDLLSAETRDRTELSSRILSEFSLHGFELVTPPIFELAEGLEKGLGTLDPAEVLRFIEPESGLVAALRPDMTPQIARLVATRLSSHPMPIRLAYQGSVIRRRRKGARRDRQISQAGVELYGVHGLKGDLEVLELASAVTRKAGLDDFIVEIGHANIARSLLEALPPQLGAEVAAALIQKDPSSIVRALGNTPIPEVIRKALIGLPELWGAIGNETEVFARSRKLLGGTEAASALEELAHLFQEAKRVLGTRAPELVERLRVDVGEVRGFDYYTGPIFHIFADGPGEAVGAGGRYDDLLSRFSLPWPATGFALNLDAILWARKAMARKEPVPQKVLVTSGPGASLLVQGLRQRNCAAVIFNSQEEEGLMHYARAWSFTKIVHLYEGGIHVTDLNAEAPTKVDVPGLNEPTEIAAFVTR